MRLQDTAHKDARPFLQVGIGKNDGRVLSTKFEGNRSQIHSGVLCNLYP